MVIDRYSISRLLFVVMTFELFMGGGGRLLEIGPGTVRMVLFSLAILWAIYLYIIPIPALSPTIRHDFVLPFLLFYLCVHTYGLFLGAINGSEIGLMFNELQQSLYFLSFPFFAYVFSRVNAIYDAIRILKISALSMSIVYILTITALLIGYLDPMEIYQVLNNTGEFMFRTEILFFYKGFVYFGVALVFFLNDYIDTGKIKLASALIFIALLLTMTRGFIVSLIVASLILVILRGRIKTAFTVSIISLVAVLVVFVFVPESNEALQSSRLASNDVRLNDYVFYYENIGLESIFGYGFGSVLNERSNVENSFFWALWKLGLPGLIFWLTPIILSSYWYFVIPRRSLYKGVASAYFSSIIFIAIQSMSNPYINNPIGISWVMISMLSLHYISIMNFPPRHK